MKRFLIFVEDPGATNMILELPDLFKSLTADYQIIANSYAANILEKKNILFKRINTHNDLIQFLKKKYI